MRNDRSRLLIQAFIGGFFAGLSLSQGIGIFMPLATALLWSVTKDISAGFVWGFVAVVVSHSWLLSLHPLTWIGLPWISSVLVAILIWLSCGFVAGFLVALWVWVGKRPFFFDLRDGGIKDKAFLFVGLASIWGLGEVLLAHYPLFWIGLGGSVLPGDRALAGLAKWIGSGGLATIQLLIGCWLWQCLEAFSKRKQWKGIFLGGLSLLLIAHFLGWNLLLKNPPSASNSVAIWQSNIPIRTKFSQYQQQRLPDLIQSSLIKAKSLNADFLVAPEGTIPSNFELTLTDHIPFLSGGFRSQSGQQRSSLLAFEKGDKTFSKYIDKHRLVPLGEWIPSFSWFPSGLSAVGGLHPGSESRLFSWSGPPLAAAICYELSDGNAIAKAVEGGAEWILALANLDPYPLPLQRQFLALAQLRSIENARDIISVANTGPTASIDATGKITKLVQPFVESVQLLRLDIHKNTFTFYSQWKEIPLVVIFLISLVGIFRIRLGKE